MNNYQLEQYLNDYYAMLRKITEPIRQLAESYTEQIKQIQQVVSDTIKPSIDKANEALREYHEKMKEFIEYAKAISIMYKEAPPSYAIEEETSIPESVEQENSPSRAPPDKSFTEKLLFWYIYLTLALMPVIPYLERLIIDSYVFEILKIVFKLFGVYL